MNRCFVCTCVCVLSVCSAHRGQDPLELELQMAASHHVGAGVWFSEEQPVLLTPQYIEICLFVCLFWGSNPDPHACRARLDQMSHPPDSVVGTLKCFSRDCMNITLTIVSLGDGLGFFLSGSPKHMAGLNGCPLEDGSSHIYLLFPGAKHPWETCW